MNFKNEMHDFRCDEKFDDLLAEYGNSFCSGSGAIDPEKLIVHIEQTVSAALIAQARASQLVQIGVAANGDLAITQDWMAYCTILRQAGKEPTDAQGDAFDFAWNAARASQPEGATGTTGASDGE